MLRSIVSSYRILCPYRTHGVLRCIVSKCRILCPYGIGCDTNMIVYVVLPYRILGVQQYILSSYRTHGVLRYIVPSYLRFYGMSRLKVRVARAPT